MAEEKDIRGFLSERFSDFEPAPERDVWLDIEEGLDTNSSVKFGAWFYTGIAAGIAVLMAVYFLYPLKNDRGNPQPVKNIAEIQPSEGTDTLYPNETLVPNKESEESLPEESIPPAPVSPPQELADKAQVSSSKDKSENKPEDLQAPPLPHEREDSLLVPQHFPPTPLRGVAEISMDSAHSQGLELQHPLTEKGLITSVEMEEQEKNSENSSGFSLKDLSLEKALLAAGEELDKRFDYSPLTAREEEKNGETVRTFRVKIGGFSITHKKKVKQSKEKRT